jgi:hypothetical protein
MRSPNTANIGVIILVAIILLIVGVLTLSVMSQNWAAQPGTTTVMVDPPSEDTTTPTPAPMLTVASGEPVTAGAFTVMAQAPSCGEDMWELQRASANTHWCIISIDVTNDSAEPAFFRPEKLTFITEGPDGEQRSYTGAMPEYTIEHPLLDPIPPQLTAASEAAAMIPADHALIAVLIPALPSSEAIAARITLG